jgi:argininosuccinate lyase
MLQRDKERFFDCLKRTDTLPLGAGALAGTSFPIDREYVAKLLKFSRITENSVDTVSDRDYLIEFLASSSLLMLHLSRLSEELVLWSSREFSFIELSEEFCGGSSIMPQKKNPDIAELIRGKTGRVYGNLFSLLTTMKGLPLSYNKDMQEDKEPLFDSVDTVKNSLNIYARVLSTMTINKERMKEVIEGDFSLATDLADYLVKKGVSFRQAYGIVKKIVRYCQAKKKNFPELSLEEFQRFSLKFKRDLFPLLKVENSVKRRTSFGGTALKRVAEEIRRAKRRWQAFP